MKTYLSLSTSDLHGNITQYEKIKQVVVEQKVSFVFFCGDLFPKTGGLWHPGNNVRTISMQKDFIKEYFISYLKNLSKYAYIYAIVGNDDFKSNYELLKKVNSKVFFLDNQIIRLPIKEELYITGYPYVSLTPFLQKDWEKRDYSDSLPENKKYRIDGYFSKDGKHFPINFSNHSEDLSTISEDLRKLAQQSSLKETIYIFHEPPYNTPLDMTTKDSKYIINGILHIGSKAVREFIEKSQPLLTMHGHIHETFQESGDYKWKCGSSLSITAANDFLIDSVSYVLFDLPTLSKIQRVTA